MEIGCTDTAQSYTLLRAFERLPSVPSGGREIQYEAGLGARITARGGQRISIAKSEDPGLQALDNPVGWQPADVTATGDGR